MESTNDFTVLVGTKRLDIIHENTVHNHGCVHVLLVTGFTQNSDICKSVDERNNSHVAN